MTNNLFKMHAMVTPAGTISSIKSRDHDPGIDRMKVRGDGRVSPESYYLMGREPKLKCSTTAIAAALTALGTSMYAFSSTTSLYFAKLTNQASYAAGSSHSRHSGSKGVIIPRKLTASHNKKATEATLDFDLIWLSSDGTTAPYSRSNSVALPSLGAVGEAFTLGAVKLNGTAVNGISSIEYDFGIREIIHASSGNVYPTFIAFDKVEPMLTVKTTDEALYDTLTMDGLAQNGTPSTFYFQKLSSTGRVAAGTSQHIKLSMTAGQFEPGAIKENEENETEYEMTAHPLDDGTNAIVAVNLASAIA